MKLPNLIAAALFLGSQANGESLGGSLRGRQLQDLTAEGAENLEQGENAPAISIDNFAIDATAVEKIEELAEDLPDNMADIQEEIEEVAEEVYVSSQAVDVEVENPADAVEDLASR